MHEFSESFWFRPSPTLPDDVAAWGRQRIEAHLSSLRSFGDEELTCEVVVGRGSLRQLLSQVVPREGLLMAAKARAHEAYAAAPHEHQAMGEAAWEGLLAAADGGFVLLEVALEVARVAAREVASEQAPGGGEEGGSAGGDAGGFRVYRGRENGKYASKAAAQRALATDPRWVALSKARQHATQSCFMAAALGAIDAAQDAAQDAATQVARRLAAALADAGLEDGEQEALLTTAWDLAHEAGRHISWHTTWSPSDDPHNPWSPLLDIWRAGLGAFHLVSGRCLLWEAPE